MVSVYQVKGKSQSPFFTEHREVMIGSALWQVAQHAILAVKPPENPVFDHQLGQFGIKFAIHWGASIF